MPPFAALSRPCMGGCEISRRRSAGRRLRRALMTLAGVAIAVSAAIAAEGLPEGITIPPQGSQIPPDENFCAMCHNEPDLWDAAQAHLFIPREKLEEDVHWQKGVNCHDCHGGSHEQPDINEAHAVENGFLLINDDDPEIRAGAREALKQRCNHCHERQKLDLFASVHSKAGPRDLRGHGTLLDCSECHGEVSHHLLPSAHSQSPVFLEHQVETCGKCHEDYRDSYKRSVHGRGLLASGLLSVATCSDCHGAHGMYRPLHQKSTLHAANVAETCGNCHRFIGDRLAASVHGTGDSPGHLAGRPAPGVEAQRQPTCTSCHDAHGSAHPHDPAFRLQLPFQCGNCHREKSHQDALRMHGQLTELGYGPAATCSDCHSAHDILAVSDPDSQVSLANRQQMCRSCHPHASANFLRFDPHADHTDPTRSPVEYYAYGGLLTLFVAVFGVFGIHSAAWFLRDLVEVARHGRNRQLVAGAMAYRRFSTFHRTAHALMVISFIGLGATGLPLKYSHYDWAKSFAYHLGGFHTMGDLHRLFGIVTIGCVAIYLVRLGTRFVKNRRAGRTWNESVFGPNSLVPNGRDFRDAARMSRWFVGLGARPTFERWAYWEKFDFWSVCLVVAIIGLSGLILWFPSLFCLVLPGAAVSVAKVIHSTQALLATGLVLAIHLFNTHLRAANFPLDMSMMTGLVSTEELERERPEFLARLRREGELEKRETVVPPRRSLLGVALAGWLVTLAGICLLAAILVTYLAR